VTAFAELIRVACTRPVDGAWTVQQARKSYRRVDQVVVLLLGLAALRDRAPGGRCVMASAAYAAERIDLGGRVVRGANVHVYRSREMVSNGESSAYTRLTKE